MTTDDIVEEVDHGVQLDCQRCGKSVHITQEELHSGRGEIHLININHPTTVLMYLLCTSCLERFIKRIDLWMKLY